MSSAIERRLPEVARTFGHAFLLPNYIYDIYTYFEVYTRHLTGNLKARPRVTGYPDLIEVVVQAGSTSHT